MSKVLVTEEYLQDIADAIREKTGGSATYTPAQMGDAIRNIPSGGGSIGQATRIINDKWDGTGSTTYTFDNDIDKCFLILTYTRETTLSDTRYTLTLASGSYTVNFDSGVIHGSTTYERVVYLLVDGIKAGDTLYVYNYGDLRTADVVEIS